MAFWNKKKKDEEESTQPSSSADSAPTSRAARAVRDLFNATVQGQQRAVQADQAVAQAGQKKLADAAQNLYAATVRGQQAATQANQAVAQAQSQRVQDAAAGLYSAYQQQQERAARQQMAQQQAQMQAPTRRAQDAAQGLYSAYLNQQQTMADMQRRQNEEQAQTMAGLYSGISDAMQGGREIYQRQLAGTDAGTQANETMTKPVIERANKRQSTLENGDPNKGAGRFANILQASDFTVKSQAREDNADELYRYINNIGDERARQQGYAAQRGAYSGLEKYQLMTDNERGVYNYLYNTQGKDAANGFLTQLDPELNEQWYTGESALNVEQANENAASRLGYSVASVGAQPARTLGSAAALVQDVIRADNGEGIDPYSEFRRASMLTQDVRGSIAEYYNEQYPGGFLGMTAGDVYNTIMSAADSAMNMAVAGYAGQTAGAIRGLENIDKVMSFTNQLGSAMMSSEVAATAIAESKRKGYSDVGALSLGMIRGGIEYLSEKIGGDWIISRMKKNPLNAFKTIAMAMIPEGVEEVMSDIGNEIVNMLVDDAYGTDESYVLQAHKQFEQQGSENPWADTLGVILKQEWKSFAGGALSALGSGGTFYVQNRGAINQVANQLNTDAKTVVQLMDELETENPDEVRLLAKLFDVKSADDMRDKIRELSEAEAAIDQQMQEREAEETAPTERAEEAARAMQENESAPTEAEAGPLYLEGDVRAEMTGRNKKKSMVERAEERRRFAAEAYNENAPTEGRGAVNIDAEGVFDNAEQSDNRGQQNGNDALGTGGADLIYEAGTQRSRVDAGDESRQRFDRVQNYAVKEEVTPAQLGVTNGSTTQRVQVLDESAFEPGSPEAMAIQSAREAGLDPVIIRGAMDIGGKQARAFISGNRVILQADARVSADKLLKHERYHRDAKRNPKLNTMIRQALVNNMTEQELGDLVSRYITAYDGVYDFSQMTQEEIERICEEELFADLYAGIDNTERTDLREAAQQGYSEAQATEQNTEAAQGATGMLEGRASREDGRWPFVDNDTNDFMFRKGNNFVSRTEAIQAEARKAAEMAADGSVRSPFADGFEQEIRNDKTPLDDIEIKPTKKLKGAKENTIRDTIRSDDQIYKGDAENKDSGLTISIGNFGTSDTGTYAVRSHNMDRGVALSGIKELVEEAKIIGTSNTEIDPTQKLKGRNNPQRMFQYIFAAPYRFVNEDGTKSDRKIAILRVDAMYDTEEGAIHRFYNLNSVDVINSGASSNDANPASETRAKLNSAPNVSISDILQIVNPNLVGNHVTVAQPGMFSVDIGGESYDELVNRAQTVQRDLESARQQLRDVENSDEYKAWVERLTSDLNDQTIAEYKQWEDANGLTELNERLDSLKKEWKDLSKRVNDAVKARQETAAKEAAQKSGLSEADYNRRQAVKEFGYTQDFVDAGYILPSGKMLNFSGEKGRHYGIRGQDHRAIGTIYPDGITGSQAMLKFMGEGNIRIMAESPGLDIATGLEPTAQQYNTIARFVNENDGRGFFNVDFTDESGRTVANLTYNGRVTAAKVKADIQHYFKTGEARKQSSLAQFRYSVEVPGDIRRQLAEAEREYMEHSDANDADYDYRAQLEKIDELRRQISEADSVNAEADNINAEVDTNPAIESLEREGSVHRGATYDAERYGDPNPERGQMGSDGVRICNTTEDLEAELNDIGGAKIRNDTGEYFARIRAKKDSGFLLTINRDGKRDISRSFGNMGEAAAYAASYIEGQTQARTDAELDAEKSKPVRKQEPIEALTTGQVQDEAKRQKQNKAAEASTQSLRDRIRKTDEEIKALRRLEKTTGLTEIQAQHKADLQETLETLNDELTSRKGRAKAKKEKVEVKGNKPVRSAAEAKNKLMDLFHTAAGQRADTNRKLDAKLAEIVSSGKITEQNRQDILDMLIDAGMVRQEAEQEFRDVRDWVRGSRIYVSEHDRADFGDDWDGLRKSAWANGIYLTNNESDRSVDSLVSELAETFGTNMFPTDDAASDMLRNLIEKTEKGRSSMITFAEAVNNEARMEHVDPQEIWNDLSRQTDETLRAFAEKAKLEVDLKDRTASMLATERKRAEDRMERMAQRRRESEIREKTFKAIRRLKKLRGKATSEVKTQIDEAIRDIDTQARQLTINGLEDLQELARVYEDAKKAAGYVDEENPGNFISNPYIEEKLNRLTQKHINEMDIDDVIELGRVVAALENTVKTNGKMIGEQFDSEVKTVADKVNAEVQSSRGAKPGFLQKWFAEEQLSPRRFLELLGGWKKGAMANLADSLEQGQTRMLDFQRRAAQSMDPFMSKKANKEWLKTASGKKAKWYTYSVANGMAADGSGVTGQTIEITPMMKVSLYLASLNEDNLRHIQTGGLVIPDKALYLKGKTQEAFAQGKRVKMQPQAVRAIASSLTQEEKTFAGYLQKFFNTQSKDAINEVSLQLDGFERADVDQYFPIESSRAFLKSDVSGEARAQTVEGIGSIANERVHASNPIVLDDAYNVFMRQVDKVSRYYGYAIPIRNFQAVNNYVFHEEGNAFAGSIKDTINRKWGAGAENYITKMLADIQGGTRKSDVLGGALSKLRGNLAGATLTLNPSVAVSQTASYPGAAQAVGWDGLAAGLTGRVDEKLIEKYTPLLWYRSQGYSTQEIGDAVSAQNKTPAQKLLASKAFNWIQAMDRMAVKRIWKAAEYRVTKDTGLKPSSKELIDSGMDPYYRKVAEVFNRAVYDTQPNYTDMERAQILRSDSDITKFLTMYKTVPLQYYGMTAEAVGRLQAAMKSGNKTEIKAARKYAADTFGGLLAANTVYVAMKALFKSFRGKDKDYKDEEGKITIESYLKQLGKDLAETYAGSVIGGAEAYSLISGWINGETFRAPEINVLSSVEDIANGFQSIFKAIDDDDPGKTAKAVKDAAENIAMVFGMPVKNAETYLMAAIRWIQPQAALQYDSFFGGLNKGDLKNMDTDTIGSAASILMQNRTGVSVDRDATNELSRLYAAGFTDAIPTAIPDSFEYGGNTVKIKDRKAYRETWGGVVGDSLEELTTSRSYIDADDKTKEAMIRKLYQYATVQARMGADPEYTVEGNSTYGWTEKADDAMESGMDLPTVIAAMTTMNGMNSDKVNGQTVKSKKTKVVEYIDGLKLDTEQKDALYELAGYESGLEKAPWHSGISAEAGYTTGTNKPVINEAARKRAVEANYQQLTSSEAYKAADDLTKKEMIEKLNQYAEVQGMVTTDPNYIPTGSAGWTIWAETAEKAGIDLISAIDYATQLDSFKADYNEYGKAISGSKKEKVEKYIDGLDLTNDQKDVLYLKLYTDSSLKYTPWHGGKKKKRRGGRRGGSRKSGTTKATKPVSVGKITPKYSTGVDVSKLFGLSGSTGTTGKSGTGKSGGLSTDLAKIVNSGLDISELFKYTPTKKAPKGRTQVDFKL